MLRHTNTFWIWLQHTYFMKSKIYFSQTLRKPTFHKICSERFCQNIKLSRQTSASSVAHQCAAAHSLRNTALDEFIFLHEKTNGKRECSSTAIRKYGWRPDTGPSKSTQTISGTHSFNLDLRIRLIKLRFYFSAGVAVFTHSFGFFSWERQVTLIIGVAKGA